MSSLRIVGLCLWLFFGTLSPALFAQQSTQQPTQQPSDQSDNQPGQSSQSKQSNNAFYDSAYINLTETHDRYIRKSISTTSTVWINKSVKEQPLPLSIPALSQQFLERIEASLSLNRFDYNHLPNNVLTEFHTELASQTELTSPQLAGIFNRTIATSIMEILNDPDIQRQRAEMLRDDADVLTFAQTKGKSSALNLDELSILFNSAYIYLPMITSVSVQNLLESFRVKIEGSLVWYQIIATDSGSYKVAIIKTVDTSGVGYSSRHTHPSKARLQEAVEQAVSTLASNLAVKTREIDVFRLKGSISEVKGFQYETSLGEKEGLKLNDYYYLYEFEELNGIVTPVNKGYLRVAHVADNISKTNTVSVLEQEIGFPQSRGAFIVEHPKSGNSLKLFGFSRGLTLSKEDIVINTPGGSFPVLSEDVSRATGVSVGLAKDLSDSLQLPQAYFDIWASYARPSVNWAGEDSGGAYLLSLYFGFSKKITMHRHGLRLGAGLGFDRLELFSATVDTDRGREDVDISLDTLGMSASMDYEVRITPKWLGFIGVNYTFSKWMINQKVSPNPRDIDMNFDRSNLGGLDIRFGVIHEFSTLTFNPVNAIFAFY